MSDTARTPLEPDAATFERWTAACVEFVRAHLASLGEQPAADVADTAAIAARFVEPAPPDGRPLDEILARLAPAFAKSLNTAGPGYLAFIPGGGLYSAALAEYVAAAVNRFVGVERAAPVLARIEAQAVAWLAREMGYPDGARGVLTSGGSMSNLLAIVAARTAHLGDDLARGTLYYSRETHSSVPKAARFAGLREANLRPLPTGDRLRLDVAALERAIAEDRARGLAPFLVVANVGTTNTGAIDPLRAILDVARRERLWVHADAAYGGFFRLASGGAALTDGIDACDSITLDPHKGLFLPYGTGCVLVRDGRRLADAHRTPGGNPAYLRDVAGDGDADFSALSPELSRDFRGLRLWLPIQLHGLDAFRAQLDEKLALARRARDFLAADARFEIVAPTELSIVAFRLRGQGDAANVELLRRVNDHKRVFLSSTVLDGRFTLRICVLSFRTHAARLDEGLAILAAEAARLA